MKPQYSKRRRPYPSGGHARRPQRKRPFAPRAALFVLKLGVLLVTLPILLAIMFFFAFALPRHASGHVVGRFFDRVLDWLVGPEAQEIVITKKRPRGFLKF